MSARSAQGSEIEASATRGSPLASAHLPILVAAAIAISISSAAFAQSAGVGLRFARIAPGEPRWIEPCARLADEMLIWLDRISNDSTSNLQEAARKRFASSVLRIRPLKAHPEACPTSDSCFRIGKTNADSAKFYRDAAQSAVRSARNIAQGSPADLRELDDFELERAQAFAKVYNCMAEGVERN